MHYMSQGYLQENDSFVNKQFNRSHTAEQLILHDEEQSTNSTK